MNDIVTGPSLAALLAQPGADPSGLTVWQAVLLFAVVPLAAVVLISAVVVAIERRPGRRVAAPGPAAPERDPETAGGVTARRQRCVVGIDERGREVHHGDVVPSADRAGASRPIQLRRLDAACWTVACTGCGRPYLEDGEAVHFATSTQAAETIQAYGWTTGTADTRCSGCRG